MNRSAYEQAVLRRLYPIGGTAAVLALLPHRSKRAIRVRACQLGIGVKKTYCPGEDARVDAAVEMFAGNMIAAAAWLGREPEYVRKAIDRRKRLLPADRIAARRRAREAIMKEHLKEILG